MLDKLFSISAYVLRRKELPNLLSPASLSEKMLYKKLFPEKQEIILRKLISDRLNVREYVRNKCSDCLLIPIIWSGEYLTQEIWDDLPSKFVIKANHGSKMVEIVDKSITNFYSVLNLTKQWMNIDYYKKGREWVYKDLPRVLIVEEYMSDLSGDVPPDYKFFCLNGKVELVQLDLSRFQGHKRNLYDREFKKLEAKLHFDNGGNIDKPNKFDKAVSIAERLSKDLDFIRVDLYILEQGIYFGEMTNFPGNCLEKFSPSYYDYMLGAKLNVKKQ